MQPIRLVRRAVVAAVSLALIAGVTPAASGHGVSGGPLGPQPVDGTAGTLLDLATQTWCDPIDPAACLLPFPNDHFTRADSSTVTGRRLDLQPQAMPRNIAGKPIDPTEWNRNDGFSPGQLVVAKVPGLSAEHTELPPIDDPGFSNGARSAVVVINAETGRRHPVWAELDSTVDGTYGGGHIDEFDVEVSPPETEPLHDPENGQALLVRPAVNWEENTRYVVVLRNMRDDRGLRIPSSPVFGAYRDGTTTPLAAFEERRPHFEELFRVVDEHHGPPVDRGEVYLAWDFTTASADNLAGRLLHMRDDAFGSLAGGAPTFEVTAVTEQPDGNVHRRIEGEFQVPRYVSSPTPGARMVYDPVTGLPMRQPTDQPATFTCNLPPPRYDGDGNLVPATVSLYGHGLLGSQGEVNSNAQREFGELENVAFCATDWLGMSTPDLATIVGLIVPDLSNFHLIPDRSQQGILSFLFLGELMRHPGGFAAHEAFQGDDGQPLIDADSLVYYGNSQGGIMGGAVAAVAHNLERAVLGVPGMNYSTLLRRSKDFDPFAALIYLNYADELDRSIIFSLLQTLWDRGEANAYAHHMTTDPYPCPESLCDGPTPHRVLLHVAFGDHQVANVSAEVEARTIGAAVHEPPPPAYNAWEQPPQDEFPLLETVVYDDGGEYDGSAMMLWDSGTPTPPFTNTPPRAGNDPHETPRRDREARRQMAHFFRTGLVLDVCDRFAPPGRTPDGSCQTHKRDG